MAAGDKILEVRDLRTHFKTKTGPIKAVDGVSFSLRKGETLCIVGESGSGKTVTSLSLMRLINPPGEVAGGEILYRGQDLLRLSDQAMADLRGDRIATVFQDPMTSLNPSFRIGGQIAEGMMVHQGLDPAEAKTRTIALMRQVGIPDPEGRYEAYPHQFSGGMRQRVLIAGAIACHPEIMIADEPTTALDVTIQAQILKLLKRLQRELQSCLILVTHDLGVVAAMADQVLVMYAGKVVEYGSVDEIFEAPRHPYTQGLLQSLVRLEETRENPLMPIPGLPPDPANLPPGCSFQTRCSAAFARCRQEVPGLQSDADRHAAACHLLDGNPSEAVGP